MFALPRVRVLPAFLILFLGLPCPAQRSRGATLAAGRHALSQGRIPEALALLHTATAANMADGEAHLLLCRAFYSEHAMDPAVEECEAAVRYLSRSSEAQDFMGRVYGMKAEKAGPLSGYALARKVKAAFEMAVSLDPANGDAIDDLGEYYLEAPGIVGGGIDKARALAQQTKNPDQGLRLKAAIAEKIKDFNSAERLLRQRTETTKGRPDTWLDLAGFYKRRGQADQAVSALHSAENAAHDRSSVLVGVAELFIDMQREGDTAIRDLQSYLSGGNTDDSAPTFKAHWLIGRVLVARGDKAGAKSEFNKALALAPDYAPAKKALSSL